MTHFGDAYGLTAVAAHPHTLQPKFASGDADERIVLLDIIELCQVAGLGPTHNSNCDRTTGRRFDNPIMGRPSQSQPDRMRCVRV
jgi:hypothetical protein